MATGKSGSFDIQGNNGVVLRILWSETYDIATNSSIVSITDIQVSFTSTYRETPYYFDGSLSVSGEIVATFSSLTGGYYVFPYALNTFYSVVVGSGYASLPFKSSAITHNTDGSKSTTISVDIAGQSVSSGRWTATGSSTVTLYTIPRASSMAIDNGTLGVEQTIKVTRAASTFTHTITYECGTASGTVCTKSSSESIKFTPPLSLAAENVSAVSVKVTFKLQTYSGSTAIGDPVSVAVSMAIPDSVVPTLSLAVTDVKGYLATYGGYVQSKSQANVVATGAGVYGSSIVSYKLVCGTATSDKSSATFELPTSGSVVVKATVTDSRGRQASMQTTITVLAYSPPSAQITALIRQNADGTANAQGDHAKATFSAAITSLGSKNAASYYFKYRVRGTTAWTKIELTALSGKYAPTDIAQTFAAATGSAYEVCITAQDSFAAVDSAYATIQSIGALFEADQILNSVGIGHIADKTNTLRVGIYAEFLEGTSLDTRIAALEERVTKLGG